MPDSTSDKERHAEIMRFASLGAERMILEKKGENTDELAQEMKRIRANLGLKKEEFLRALMEVFPG